MKPPTGDPPSAYSKPSVTRTIAAAFLLAVALYWLSVGAYFAFLIGGRLTHSVPAARAFDAVGTLFLLPGRLVLWRAPAYILFFPSVIVPVNTGAWLVLLCLGFALNKRFRR